MSKWKRPGVLMQKIKLNLLNTKLPEIHYHSKKWKQALNQEMLEQFYGITLLVLFTDGAVLLNQHMSIV